MAVPAEIRSTLELYRTVALNRGDEIRRSNPAMSIGHGDTHCARALIDIRLLDHIIIGDGVSVSLAEPGPL
jgi:hypothetical protein